MIVLVRHGQTAVNRSGRLQGRVDAELTTVGRAQAAALASVLAREPVRRVVTSPLRRARETAAPVAEACNCPVDVDDRLVEIDYGSWDGRLLSDVAEHEWARWRADPTWAPPGGESHVDVRSRVGACCEALLADADDESVVAVSHVSPIKAAVTWALDVDDRVSWRTYLGLASLTRIGRRGGRPVLLSFNETTHLAAVESGTGDPGAARR